MYLHIIKNKLNVKRLLDRKSGHLHNEIISGINS